GELAQWAEWSHDRSLDWHLLAEEAHAGVQRLMIDIGARYHDIPALWRHDHDSRGFLWIDAGNVDQNILAFIRFDANDDPGLVSIANFFPSTYFDPRLRLPRAGPWH